MPTISAPRAVVTVSPRKSGSRSRSDLSWRRRLTFEGGRGDHGHRATHKRKRVSRESSLDKDDGDTFVSWRVSENRYLMMSLAQWQDDSVDWEAIVEYLPERTSHSTQQHWERCEKTYAEILAARYRVDASSIRLLSRQWVRGRYCLQLDPNIDQDELVVVMNQVAADQAMEENKRRINTRILSSSLSLDSRSTESSIRSARGVLSSSSNRSSSSRKRHKRARREYGMSPRKTGKLFVKDVVKPGARIITIKVETIEENESHREDADVSIGTGKSQTQILESFVGASTDQVPWAGESSEEAEPGPSDNRSHLNNDDEELADDEAEEPEEEEWSPAGPEFDLDDRSSEEVADDIDANTHSDEIDSDNESEHVNVTNSDGVSKDKSPVSTRAEIQEGNSASSSKSKGTLMGSAEREPVATQLQPQTTSDPDKSSDARKQDQCMVTPAKNIDPIKEGNGSSDTSNKLQTITEEDRSLLSDYVVVVIEQILPCMAAKNLFDSSGCPVQVGAPGLVCRHCKTGSGRLFFSSAIQLRESLEFFHEHLADCPKVPLELKDEITASFSTHDEQTKQLPSGNETMYFGRFWERLKNKIQQKSSGENSDRSKKKSLGQKSTDLALSSKEISSSASNDMESAEDQGQANQEHSTEESGVERPNGLEKVGDSNDDCSAKENGSDQSEAESEGDKDELPKRGRGLSRKNSVEDDESRDTTGEEEEPEQKPQRRRGQPRKARPPEEAKPAPKKKNPAPTISANGILGGIIFSKLGLISPEQQAIIPKEENPPQPEKPSVDSEQFGMHGVNEFLEIFDVDDKDKRLLSDYIVVVMEQVVACWAQEEDTKRNVKPRIRKGYPGLACKHCKAQTRCQREGKYFFTTPESLCQAHRLFREHLSVCRDTPSHVNDEIASHLKTHQRQVKQLRSGQQTAYFERLWERLQTTNIADSSDEEEDDSDSDRGHSSGQDVSNSNSNAGSSDNDQEEEDSIEETNGQNEASDEMTSDDENEGAAEDESNYGGQSDSGSENNDNRGEGGEGDRESETEESVEGSRRTRRSKRPHKPLERPSM